LVPPSDDICQLLPEIGLPVALKLAPQLLPSSWGGPNNCSVILGALDSSVTVTLKTFDVVVGPPG
jgi:hypothetical protein